MSGNPELSISFAEVLSVLRTCRFPPVSKEMLRALINREGRTIGAAILAIRENATDVTERRRFLHERILCVCEPTLALLQKAGYPIPPAELMADIARHEGMNFYRSVAALPSSTSNQARKHIEGVFRSYGFDFSERAPATESPSFEHAPQGDLLTPALFDAEVSPPPPEVTERPIDEVFEDDSPAPDALDDKRRFESVTLYGSKSAVSLTAATSRARQTPTLMLDGAPARPGIPPGAKDRYDWNRKVSIQLADRELVALVAVLLRKQPLLEGRGRGEAHNKSFQIKHQAGGYFFSIHQGTTGFAVPITNAAGFGVLSLALKQLQQAHPHLSIDNILSLIPSLFDEDQL